MYSYTKKETTTYYNYKEPFKKMSLYNEKIKREYDNKTSTNKQDKWKKQFQEVENCLQELRDKLNNLSESLKESYNIDSL